VSSPMTASATFRGSPYLPMTSLASPTVITLAWTFTCFELGVRSRTFVRVFSISSPLRVSRCRCRSPKPLAHLGAAHVQKRERGARKRAAGLGILRQNHASHHI